MPAPAEAYAAARSRAARPRLTEFAAILPFELDGFQQTACAALEDGHGVLVCAPTGAGKTVVGEFAVHLAIAQGRKCFYTTPIKALSNQKYADLVARHGADAVGLLTGDTSVNGDAQVVVMTTEVLRNMIYAEGSLADPGVGRRSRQLEHLGFVVMDEVHYLADRFRGAVWEEVILQLPEHVALVSLSATVSNAEEFGDWLVTVRGDTTVVVDEHRPVPLWQHMAVGNRLIDLFGGEDENGELQVDPDLVRYTTDLERQSAVWDRGRGRGPKGNGRSTTRFRPPSRTTVIDRLDRDGLLPAITFVFSRAGCDAAVGQCVRSGLRLNGQDEIAEIRRVVEKHTGDLPQGDLEVLGYWEWRDALERGIAAHHAGMLPAFKETVEELFVRGLVRAVFATETLALGINMPARTVVLERLVKYNGESHAELTPGEYTQLTGRAGRRGIDVEGHAVVVWQPGIDPVQVAGLASTRTYPLRSSFRPGYNMAVNLVGRLGTDAARDLLEQSLGQFQADRSVVGLARRIERNLDALDGYATSMRCHLGDFAEYAALRRQVGDRERSLSRLGSDDQRAAAAESLRILRPGDVIAVPAGRRAGLAVVLDPGIDPTGDPRPLVLSEDKWAGRLSTSDFPTPVEALGRMRLPKRVDHRVPRVRRDLASGLTDTGIRAPSVPRRRGRGGAVDDPELASLRRALRAHPCHGCDDREAHARWAERHARLERETEQLRQKVRATTHSLARAFDRIRELLRERGYLAEGPLAGPSISAEGPLAGPSISAEGPLAGPSISAEGPLAGPSISAEGPLAGPDSDDTSVGVGERGEVVTEDGRRLARLWGESDLLTAECLRHDVWDGLEPADLASVVSALVYESRRDNGPVPRVPTGPVSDALATTVRIWAELEADERRHRVDRTREPDLGFAWPMHRWARGESLSAVLTAAEQNGSELSAGDFVRWCRQVVDLLDQIAGVAGRGSAVGRAAAQAVTAVRRGLVAAGTV